MSNSSYDSHLLIGFGGDGGVGGRRGRFGRLGVAFWAQKAPLDVLQRPILRLGQQEDGEEDAGQTEGGEEPEGARLAQQVDQLQEELGDDEGRAPVDRRRHPADHAPGVVRSHLCKTKTVLLQLF